MKDILIIEDDATVRDILVRDLSKRGFKVHAEACGRDGLGSKGLKSASVVLLDWHLPDMEGAEVLRELRKEESGPEVIVLTAHGSIHSAVQAMKEGAFDFLEKPCRLAELEAVLHKAIEIHALRDKNRSLGELLNRPHGFLGQGKRAVEFRALLEKVGASIFPVVIRGETGSGKEIAARFLHQQSPRRNGPFVAIDCGALQTSLAESELFGHERGSFTGAHASRMGLVEVASEGTLFLDEVGELTPEIQAKLLRLLESGEYRRVGGRETLEARARLMAATHRDLEKAVKEGSFREDLYYRLNVLRVDVPPLRERHEDIPLFVEHFIRRSTTEPITISDETLERMKAYSWPGNVRELRNVVERMIVLREGNELTPGDLPKELEPRESEDTDRTLAAFERRFILETLRRHGGNKAQTARELDISPTTLYNKLARYRDSGDVESPDPERPPSKN